jgi:uncharacterized protein (DUF58 family)
VIVATVQERVAPSADWQGVLHRTFGGPNEHLSWLELHFHPLWERWVVYQMVPHGKESGFLLADEQPHGHFGPAIERELLDLGQKQLYDRTGHYASPLWIVQGDRGGHRRRFWPYERTLAAMARLPEDPPLPGELPYAEMSWLVIEELHKLDQVNKWNKMLEFCDRHQDDLDEDELEGQRELRRKLLGWVQEQVSQVFETMTRRDIAAAIDEIPHGLGKRREFDHEEWMARKLTPPGTIIT